MLKKITTAFVLLLPLILSACGVKSAPFIKDAEYQYPGEYPIMDEDDFPVCE